MAFERSAPTGFRIRPAEICRIELAPQPIEASGDPERLASGGTYDNFCIDDEKRIAFLTVHRENKNRSRSS